VDFSPREKIYSLPKDALFILNAAAVESFNPEPAATPATVRMD